MTSFFSIILGPVKLILPLFLFCEYIDAQSQIEGKIVDESSIPLGFANILLLQANDSMFIKGEIANDDGQYQFQNIPYGDYICEFRMVGYPNKHSPKFTLSAVSSVVSLGTTTMDESITLDGVEIVAKRAFLEQKIDRTIVNVSNSITNAGGNALEVLQRSPGIQINRLSRTISLVGKEGVVIMINGQISRIPADAVIQLLEGMNADNIDRIELIHTPPANFEAQGNAGIINIVLKSTGDEGLNGTYSLNIGRGRGDKYGGSFNFNYRKKIVNIFGGYDHKYNLNPQVFTNYRGISQGNDFLETDSRSERSRTPTTGQNIRLGIDFQLTKNTVLGVLTTMLDRNWYMEAINNASYYTNGSVDSRIVMPNIETNHARSYTGNINLTHKFFGNQTINIDADLVSYKINKPSNYDINESNSAGIPESECTIRIDKKTPIKIGVVKMDYTWEVNKKIKFEAGAKYTTTGFDNNVIVDSSQTNNNWYNLKDYTNYSTLEENITGAYGTLSGKISDKTEYKGGLRYEYTNTNLSAIGQPNIVDRHYPSWFPSFFLNHKISDKNSINFSYSRRISRPGLMQMAAFLVFSDPTTLLGGNPAIQPSFTNALKLDLSHNSIRFGLSYSIEKSPIGIVPTVNAITNRQINSWQNLIDTKVANANIYFPLHPTSWYDLTSNFFINSSSTNFKLEGKLFQIQNVNYGFNINNNIKLPKDFALEVTGNFNSPGYWGVAKSKANGTFNIGVQKSLGNKWGNLRLNVNDIFLSSNWYLFTNQPQVNLLVNSSFRFAERVFMLSWTNTFGNTKLKSSRTRQTGSAEDVKRI
ncbi:MAG: outer membrane beta-barrel protein [Saprospiraceae bacterium]|nr:outer membrane beta-barrel protein [Saprospiraceae bacterium]